MPRVQLHDWSHRQKQGTKVQKRTYILADGIPSGKHYLPDLQGAKTHIHQRQRILAFHSQYSWKSLKQIFTWHKSSALTRPFTAPIMLTCTKSHHSVRFCISVHLCVCVCVWMSECMNVFDPDINSVATKLSSLPRTDVKTALKSARTCCKIIWGVLSCSCARPHSSRF